LVGGNLILWRSKKKNVGAKSSAEAKYQAVALATCELIRLKQLLKELRFGDLGLMRLICDNRAALHIASNPIFHEQTKHMEIDYNFMREKLISKEISTSFVGSNDQLADLPTKALLGLRFDSICIKLGTYDMYEPA